MFFVLRSQRCPAAERKRGEKLVSLILIDVVVVDVIISTNEQPATGTAAILVTWRGIVFVCRWTQSRVELLLTTKWNRTRTNRQTDRQTDGQITHAHTERDSRISLRTITASALFADTSNHRRSNSGFCFRPIYCSSSLAWNDLVWELFTRSSLCYTCIATFFSLI